MPRFFNLAFFGFYSIVAWAVPPSGLEYVQKVAKLEVSSTEGILVHLPPNFVAEAPRALEWPEKKPLLYGGDGDAELATLIAAVNARPEEDTPRKLLGEYIAETSGSAELVEFIELQLSFANYDTTFPRHIYGRDYPTFPAIAERMMALAEKHHAQWFFPFYRAVLENAEAVTEASFDKHRPGSAGAFAAADHYPLPGSPLSIARFEIRRGAIDLVAPVVGAHSVWAPEVESAVTEWWDRELKNWWRSVQPGPSIHIAGIELPMDQDRLLAEALDQRDFPVRRLRLTANDPRLWGDVMEEDPRAPKRLLTPRLEHLEIDCSAEVSASETHRILRGTLDVVAEENIVLRSLRMHGALSPWTYFGDLRKPSIPTKHLTFVDLSKSPLGADFVTNFVMDHSFFKRVQVLLLDGTGAEIKTVEALMASSTLRSLRAVGLSGNPSLSASSALVEIENNYRDASPRLSYVNVAPGLYEGEPKPQPPATEKKQPPTCANALAAAGLHVVY